MKLNKMIKPLIAACIVTSCAPSYACKEEDAIPATVLAQCILKMEDVGWPIDKVEKVNLCKKEYEGAVKYQQLKKQQEGGQYD